jgi:uncharacterized protein YcgI (DUF1989 family)
MIREFTISPSTGRAFSLSKGDSIRVIDPEGRQVSDFVAVSTVDKKEKFDQARTRVNNWSNKVIKGTKLYSNRNNELLEVVEDSVGIHDIMFPCCNTYVYENIFHVPPRNGCFENLANALSQFSINPDELPNPLNIFMNTFVDSNTGEISIRTSTSKPGDSMTMLALRDLVVAASACADDLSECNAKKCKPIRVEIINPK